MLRTAVLIVALALLAIGLGTWLGGVQGTFPLAIWGALLTAAVLFERWRYNSGAARGSGWKETGERFIDPQSGQPMQVLYNERTGERRYQALAPENKS